MRIPKLSGLTRRVRKWLGLDCDRFLRKVNGLIHVGANAGQERDKYQAFGLNVIWIEPIPDVFETLQRNIASYPNQSAYQCLITDQDNQSYTLNVASNNGESSSIFEFREHAEIWPDIKYVKQIPMVSKSLGTFLIENQVDFKKIEALVIDTQGSELLVLQGAGKLLQNFKYVKTEVSDFEAYEGGTQLSSILEYMTANGFAEQTRERFAAKANGQGYYDILFERRGS